MTRWPILHISLSPQLRTPNPHPPFPGRGEMKSKKRTADICVSEKGYEYTKQKKRNHGSEVTQGRDLAIIM